MRPMAILTISVAMTACSREAPSSTQSAQSASAVPIASSAPAWKPHKLAKLDAQMFCAELVEGNITQKCVGNEGGKGSDVDVFAIPGRQRTEAHGTIVSFGDGSGSFERWIAEALAGDAGVDPVYHYNAHAKVLVSFAGEVPEDTKLHVVEALDAL